RSRRKPTGPWRAALAAALAAALPRLAPWQVARAAVALAKMRLAAPFTLVVGLLQSLHSRLHLASPADVAALVWALRFVSLPYTQLLVRIHKRRLRDLAAATQPHLGRLPAGQLVQLVEGFAGLGLLPGEEWMRLHREACLRQRARFSETNRRKIRQAYAKMWTL
ncbi:hypothetical protein Agub_g11942, partial [Astrephomene gubernaculifera]